MSRVAKSIFKPWQRKTYKDGAEKCNDNATKEKETKPVAQRHQVVSDTLALLLFIGVDLPWGSRAAAPIGDKVL